MNLSKSEKLLAARKKLKEFQQNKKINIQEELSKNENGITKVSQQNETVEINSYANQLRNDHNVPTNNTLQSFTFPVDSKDSHVNTEMVNFVSINEDKISVKKVNEEDIPKQNANIEMTNVPVLSTMDNSQVQKQTILEFNEKNIDYFNTNKNKNENDYTSQKDNTIINKSEESTDNNNKSETFDSDTYSQNSNITYLEHQNQIVNQLQSQVKLYSNKISELQAALAAKDAEVETKLMEETKQLKEQLQIHVQTTNVLILEKAELTSVLSKNETTIKNNREEIEELSEKLKYAQFRSSEFEKELNVIKNDAEEARKIAQQMKLDHEELNEKYSELKKEKDELNLQVSELKQKLNVKNSELINVQQTLQEKAALLSLNELKIQQLTNTSQDLEVLDNQHHNVTMLEQQVAQMRETIKTVSEENDEASKQYQNYVRQLETQQETLVNELEHQKKLNNELEIREKSYIERLSDFEQKLQSEKEKVEELLPLQSHKHHIDALLKEIDELTLAQERFHIIINEKETEIEILKKELQQLQNNENQSTDVPKLLQALESEQLGASRAVSQNQQLKQQLNEMHDAFIILSNTKLDLTEQLQSERTIGRKLNSELNKVESEVEFLKNCLKAKEESCLELEKENLQNAQIIDQIHHYQAQAHYTQTLQQELHKALTTIDDLKRENEKLVEELNHGKTEKENNGVDELNLTNEVLGNNNDNVDKDILNTRETKTISCYTMTDSTSLEPLQKLEERFKETMEKLAEVLDEKQRLEHLVLQLQCETETIGEYIALYQRQRAILQERAKEKNEAFRQLIEQKNEQQEQLHKLKELVTNLITKKSIATDNTGLYISDHKEENADIITSENKQENHNVISEISNDETTSQIIDLLTEIKDCKDQCTIASNFHPCPWCSGKLINV
ncbi:PREDICTED: golgin subfamily A member 2 [Polistes dominula]|uniref:Golgin subfamily A member 2 n=1 Tax=Polistes dominula TaxID=743375 RepID=A0ABM1HUR9_POLDO|nr:PREDICTED: golgin subfamily A member 2 [Polistes dominula]XP_015171707.1 PREDICTED: golgin subfamily A member 2 [Polistes dominula]